MLKELLFSTLMSTHYAEIEDFYQKNNIYCSIIVYTDFKIDDLIYFLRLHDYPFYNLLNLEHYFSIEKKDNIRMWVIPENKFLQWLLINHFNIETISVIFCIGSCSYNTISDIKWMELVNFHPHLKIVWL